MERQEFELVWLINDTYQVLNTETESVEYQSSLANCEAFIRLKECDTF